MPAYVCTGDGSAEENAEENETDEEALGGVHTRDRYPVLVMDTAEAVVHGDADSYSEEKTNPYPTARRKLTLTLLLPLTLSLTS